MLDQVAVIIPAFNEEAALPLVLRDLPQVGAIIVANNCSTDNTAEVARQTGATVIDEPRKGYGSACLAGLAELDRLINSGKTPPQVVAFIDADYSDHSDLLPEIVKPIIEDQADFVLGSRMLGEREPGAMPPQSRFGNRLACFLMRVFYRAKYTDLGPFRAIQYNKLQQLAMEDTNFGWTIEMQIKAVKSGLRIEEIPVPYRRRIGTSKISGTVKGTIQAGVKILYSFAKYGGWRPEGVADE